MARKNRFWRAWAGAGALLLALPLMASFAGTDVFLPSVGRGTGKQHSQWYTTVWVYNPQHTAVNITVAFLKRDQPNPSPLTYNDTIPAGDVRKYENAVFTLFGVEEFGALRVTSDQRVVVNARIFSQPPEGEEESVGQFMGAAPASFAIGQGSTAQILGLYQTAPEESSTYRYNYGFVETTGQSATVTTRAYDEDGTLLATDVLTMGGFEARQYNVKDRLLGSTDVDNARIEVEVTGGFGKVIAFGTGLANSSNDSSVFEMTFSDELLAENGSDGGGDITAVKAGEGLAGGGTSGDVAISGTLTKSGGSFKIDHPLDPENKYLSHSFVESPDMMNIYNGNVRTDADGYAVVQLPEWFEALNRDFRYQLTVIGQFAQAIIAEKIHDGRFVIRTNLGQVEVSWQVTGIRHDPWANAHRIPVEEVKPSEEQGSYLVPEVYGKPASLSLEAKLGKVRRAGPAGAEADR